MSRSNQPRRPPGGSTTATRLRRHALVAGAAALVLAARVLRAEDADFDRSLEELTGKEVSSVSKVPQRLSEALASVIIVTGEEIRRFGYRTLAEALERVSGFYAYENRSYTFLGVRGLSVPGDYNGRVLLLVDGHRLIDPNYDYAPLAEDFPVDVNSIERIEVSKGTTSVVWGTNAIFATINVITRSGRAVDGGRAVAEYGTYDRRKAFVETGALTEGGVEYYLAGALSRSDGERFVSLPNGSFDENNDGFHSGRVNARASWQGVNFLLNAGERTKQTPGAPYETTFDDSYPTYDRILNLELNTERAVSASDLILFRLYHDRQSYYSSYYYDGEEGSVRRGLDESVTRVAGAEMRLRGSLFDRSSYIVGMEHQRAYELGIRTREINQLQELSAFDGDYSLVSAYGESSLALTGSLSLLLGGRVDRYSLFPTELSPRVGLVYQAAPRVTFKAIYGEAFRIPNNYERQGGRIDDPAIPALRPERGRGFEGVGLFRLGSEHRIQASVFDYTLDDVIRGFEVEAALASFRNSGSNRSRGLDLWWEKRTDDGYLWYAGSSYADVEDGTGGRIINSPRLVASSGVSVPLFDRRYYVSPEFRYQSKKETLSGDSMPGRGIWNLTLGSLPTESGVSTSLSVYNLLDTPTPYVLPEYYPTDRMPDEGRTVMFRISFGFF